MAGAILASLFRVGKLKKSAYTLREKWEKLVPISTRCGRQQQLVTIKDTGGSKVAWAISMLPFII